ncbi:hypothetical protein HDV00_002992 [Rhizophlyctis rosea]|nr:hypothetical protein HDV00_002992 [Rhizophlyctis rosea]
MSLTPPDELKFINTYLQRAAELQTKEPIVAYYCNYYAAKQAIDKGAKSKESQAFLLHLMDDLEKERKVVGTNEAITNDVVGYAHIENFALKIFLNADNEDRNGGASKKTAKTFLAAAIFLELLKVFGEVDSEVQEKIRYAKWKAADIIKALKEGRTPVPGPPGGEPQEQQPFSGGGDDSIAGGLGGGMPGGFDAFGQQQPMSPHYDPQYQQQQPSPFPPSDPYHQQQPQPSYDPNAGNTQYPGYPQQGYPQHQQQPPSFHQQPSTPSSSHPASPGPGGFSYAQQPAAPTLPPRATTASAPLPSTSSGGGSSGSGFDAYTMDHKAIQAAQKHSRFAISALQYDDVNTAVDNLEKALGLLRGMQRGGGGRGF